jgi:hypothetical protein
VSQFDGPVIFTNKITSNSDIETNSILLQGEEEVSRKFSIINQSPTTSGNYGDILFNSEPSKYEFIGWTYVTENTWEPFGWVGEQGVGIAYAGNYVGFTTLINLVATGFTFGVTYDASSGISTLTWDADPKVAISTGAANNLLGNFNQLNFIGGGVAISGDVNTGIATIQISGSVGASGTTPGEPYNSLQWNDNDGFSGVPIAFYDDINNTVRFGSLIQDSSSIIINSFGRLGIGSAVPNSKLEIVSTNATSLYIKSSSGTDILRVDNTANDATPFIIDANGNVGINTASTVAALDIIGNAAITGQLRIYETDRSNYVAITSPSLSSNYTLTLPTTTGSNGQILTTNGSGVLSWSTPSGSGNTVVGGSGIQVSFNGSIATISNSGVTNLTAGTGIAISGSTGNVTISATQQTPQVYPFTNRGFAWLI